MASIRTGCSLVSVGSVDRGADQELKSATSTSGFKGGTVAGPHSTTISYRSTSIGVPDSGSRPGGLVLVVTAPERPRRWPGSPCGCPVAASARRRSRRPIRGRLGRFRDQLHRISLRPSLKLAHVSGNLLIVQVLLGELALLAPSRNPPHPVAKHGLAC